MVKRYNFQLIILALPVMLALVSLGCGLSSRLNQSSSRVPTRTPMPTFTATPAGAAFVTVAPINTQPNTNETPAPTEVSQPAAPPPTTPPTVQPVDTATPAPAGVTVVVLQDMNVRAGPGTNYPVVGSGKAGQSTKVIGRNADGTWLQVEFPSTDGKGWVFTKLVQVNGNPETLAIAQASAAPAAAPAQASAEKTDDNKDKEEAAPAAPEKKYQFTPTGWHASQNAAIVQFKGRIKDEGGGLVNGFSVLGDNGAFRVLSHPTGGSRWYPDKGDGEWDIVFPNIATAQGTWWLTVVKYECDFNSGFDAQCQSYTKLSESVQANVETPTESIINADWICHWDCDKGLYKDGFRR